MRHIVLIRRLAFISGCIVTLLSTDWLHAQAVKVVKKSPPQIGADEYVVYDHWISSWGLKNDPPDVYSMGIAGHATSAEAVAAANAHIARTAGNGAYAVTHYLIEGEPSVRSKKGPSLPSDKRVETDAMKDLQDDLKQSINKILKGDVANLFKKKNQDVKDAYRRAKEAKELLVRNVDRIAEDDFKKANALISTYNSLKDQYAGEKEYPQYFAALPRMTPVSGDDAKRQQQKWKQSQESRSDLEKEKAELDAEKVRLEKERQEFLDGRTFENEIAEASKRVEDLENEPDGFPLIGGTTWRPTTNAGRGDYEFFAGEKSGKVVSHPRAEMRKFASPDKEGTWTVKDGNTIQIDLNAGGRPGYSSYSPPEKLVVKVTGKGSISIEGAPFGGGEVQFKSTSDKSKNADRLKAAKDKLLSIRQAQKSRDSRRVQYQSDLEKYQQRVAAFQQKLAKHRVLVSEWKQDQYTPRANVPTR